MLIRKSYSPKKMDEAEAPSLNRELERLHSTKMGASFHKNSTASEFLVIPHQEIETGFIWQSATNSSASGVTTVIALGDNHANTLFADATIRNTTLMLHIIDVTASSFTVSTEIRSGAPNFSAVFTASWVINYIHVGYAP